jgi:hypothetical protein
MKFLAFLLALAISGIAFAEEPEPVKVYCFSADLEAGFKDKLGSWFCETLEKRGRKKKSVTFADRQNADVIMEYIGMEKLGTKSDGTTLYSRGIAVSGEKNVNRCESKMTIGDYEKIFTSGHHSDMVNTIESWIRENREVILQKAREK